MSCGPQAVDGFAGGAPAWCRISTSVSAFSCRLASQIAICFACAAISFAGAQQINHLGRVLAQLPSRSCAEPVATTLTPPPTGANAGGSSSRWYSYGRYRPLPLKAARSTAGRRRAIPVNSPGSFHLFVRKQHNRCASRSTTTKTPSASARNIPVHLTARTPESCNLGSAELRQQHVALRALRGAAGRGPKRCTPRLPPLFRYRRILQCRDHQAPAGPGWPSLPCTRPSTRPQ